MMKVEVSRSERRWVIAWAAAIALLASIPYVIGLLIAPSGFHFIGFTHNIDDGAVYLSWMRQAADGHFFIRNLYTNEPQAALQFNLLFFIMGMFARFTHVPLIWVFHIFRVSLGMALLYAVWRFSLLFLDSAGQRRLLIPILGLSAGIGWLIPGAKMPVGPVDIWQPEAITFLSMYLNPLFLAGLILMVGTLYYLMIAERTGRARYAVYAGLSMLCLANIHTYDMLTLTAVWAVYLMARAIIERVFPVRLLLFSLIAGLIAAPAVAYQCYIYAIDPVYHARANTVIASPPIWSLFAGYGLVLIGAMIGAIALSIRARKMPHLLLVIWAIVGFAVPYIPIAQQRKLIMGLHIPLCILCAYALSVFLSRLPRSYAKLAAILFVVLSAGSISHFITEDLNYIRDGTTAPQFPAYMSDTELSTMNYLQHSGKWSDTVLAPPAFSLFVPALTGHQVYYGHWSETPDYGRKLCEWARSYNSPGEYGNLINASRASYIIDIQDKPAGELRLQGGSGGVELKDSYSVGAEPIIITVYSVVRAD